VSLTIAENRVDKMHDALRALVTARDHWKILERELREAKKAIDLAAEAIYDGTLYDPEGERDDA
jgi:hypothetical protein